MLSAAGPERLAALAALGLGPDASGSDISSAYRRLARNSHPDTAPECGATGDFAIINAAYRYLLQAESLRSASARPAPKAPARRPTGHSDGTGGDVAGGQVSPRRWRDEPPVVAGPVIVRPLPPESR